MHYGKLTETCHYDNAVQFLALIVSAPDKLAQQARPSPSRGETRGRTAQTVMTIIMYLDTVW